ncbi:unnamed protein product [Bodo saltans]|uniref:Uncharacterized protein n=1 Tax=Bodo saltans TaxID=75058 RepID=A0A0S4IMF8_BODSA|nr:unnamed protein product [Bodo saltans]|eukprot:CUE72470.1 unnamed protein product [Bodo saltans]
MLAMVAHLQEYISESPGEPQIQVRMMGIQVRMMGGEDDGDPGEDDGDPGDEDDGDIRSSGCSPMICRCVLMDSASDVIVWGDASQVASCICDIDRSYRFNSPRRRRRGVTVSISFVRPVSVPRRLSVVDVFQLRIFAMRRGASVMLFATVKVKVHFFLLVRENILRRTYYRPRLNPSLTSCFTLCLFQPTTVRCVTWSTTYGWPRVVFCAPRLLSQGRFPRESLLLNRDPPPATP